ncbi:hypothetical protein KKA00_09280 [bacterium]|nr:hypothetical protein [bacterium]MBU1652401.1 hypothetical protein [bacterium]MBU1881242.1 hypothetical protein [bacterium]
MFKLKAVLLGLTLLLIWAGISTAEDDKSSLFGIQNDPILVDEAMRSFQPQGFSVAEPDAGPVSSRPTKRITQNGAMFRSLLIPGWGESYLGYHETARWFFWTDVAIWSGIIGLEVFSNWKEDQFIAFASTHANTSMQGKSDDFFADIGNYNSTEEYNEAKLRERNYDALYTNASDFWAWDTAGNREEYDAIRIASRSAHNKVFFFVGAAALNRLISFVDTGKKARDVIKKQKQPNLGFHVQPGFQGDSNTIQLVFSAGL